MSDYYTTKVRRIDGGDALQVASGGEIKIESGGKITSAGTQAAAIADVPTDTSADAAANATAINSILAALRGVGIIAT